MAPLLIFTLCGFGTAILLRGQLLWAFVAVMFALCAVVMVQRPELSTNVVLFVLYSNIAVALLKYHASGGVSSQAAGAMPVLDTDSRVGVLAFVGVALLVPFYHYVCIRRQAVVLDRTLALMWVFTAALLLSAVFSVDPAFAVRKIFRFLLEGIVLYFLIINVVRDKRGLKTAMWAVLVAGCVAAALTVFQEATGTQANTYWGMAQRGGVFEIGAHGEEVLTRTRAAGPIGEQNRYAQILLVLLPLAAFFVARGETRRQRLAALVAGCIMFAAILLTFSRGAFVTLVIVLGLAGATRIVKWSHLAVIVVIAAGFTVVQPDYLVRLRSLANIQSLLKADGRPTADGSAASRLAGNVASVQTFLEHPFLGVGRGVYAQYYATPAVYRLGVRQVKNYPSHNLYLNLAAEGGILALGVFMAIVISLAMQLRRQRISLSHSNPELSDLAAYWFLALCAYLVSGMFLHLAFERYFWLQLALSSAAVRITNSAPAGSLSAQ